MNSWVTECAEQLSGRSPDVLISVTVANTKVTINPATLEIPAGMFKALKQLPVFHGGRLTSSVFQQILQADRCRGLGRGLQIPSLPCLCPAPLMLWRALACDG